MPSVITTSFVESRSEARLRYPGSIVVFHFTSDTTDVNLPKQGAFVAAGFSAPSSAQQVIAWYTTRLVSAGWTPGVDRGIHTPPRHIFAHGREEFILQLYPDVADSYRLHPGPGTVVFERTLSIESCSGAPQYC